MFSQNHFAKLRSIGISIFHIYHGVFQMMSASISPPFPFQIWMMGLMAPPPPISYENVKKFKPAPRACERSPVQQVMGGLKDLESSVGARMDSFESLTGDLSKLIQGLVATKATH